MPVELADIGKGIKRVRISKGMSQEKLAEKVEVNTTHISHIETGNVTPSIRVFVKILNALEVSADELLYSYIDKYKNLAVSIISEELKDCTKEELRIIEDTILYTKQMLRKYDSLKK